MSGDAGDAVSPADHTARWHAEHHEVVERVYRARLRSVPDYVKDGIQSFWLAFLEEKLYGRFDAIKCPSEAGYLGVLAQGRALNLLHKIWSERKRQEPGAEIDKGKGASPSAEARGRGNEELPATNHLIQLISTNRPKAPEALIFICKEWADLGPTELAEKYMTWTMFQLCDLVASGLEASGDELEMSQHLLATLREQLALPVEDPIGARTLADLVRAWDQGGREDGHSEPDVKAVLLYSLDQARRVFQPPKDTGSCDESVRHFAIRLATCFLAELERRLKFVVETLRALMDPEKLLVWGWEKLLNMRENSYGGLSCGQAADWLIRRMRFLVPQHPIPADLSDSLAGPHPAETILRRLAALNTDSTRTVRAVEARYRRFCLRSEIHG